MPDDTKEISPDVAGWRRERMPELPVNEPIRMVPDWVCEILSPTTRRHDMLRKQPYYAKVGVPLMSLPVVEVDPTQGGASGRPTVLLPVRPSRIQYSRSPLPSA